MYLLLRRPEYLYSVLSSWDLGGVKGMLSHFSSAKCERVVTCFDVSCMNGKIDIFSNDSKAFNLTYLHTANSPSPISSDVIYRGTESSTSSKFDFAKFEKFGFIPTLR